MQPRACCYIINICMDMTHNCLVGAKTHYSVKNVTKCKNHSLNYFIHKFRIVICIVICMYGNVICMAHRHLQKLIFHMNVELELKYFHFSVVSDSAGSKESNVCRKNGRKKWPSHPNPPVFSHSPARAHRFWLDTNFLWNY